MGKRKKLAFLKNRLSLLWKVNYGAGETSVNWLSWRLEVLSLNPQHPRWRSRQGVACVYKLRAEEAETGRSLYVIGPVILTDWRTPGSVRDPASKTRWRAVEKDNQVWLLASPCAYTDVPQVFANTHTGTETHTYTHMHMQGRKVNYSQVWWHILVIKSQCSEGQIKRNVTSLVAYWRNSWAR